MRVFVTGAAGFVGQHLVRQLLEAGHHASLLAPRRGASEAVRRVLPGPWIEADLADAAALEPVLRGHDAAVHLAGWFPLLGQASAERLLAQANVDTTAALLQACTRADVRQVVLASTAHVYGGAHPAPCHEDHALEGASPYALSKISAERLLHEWATAPGHSGVSLRLFNVFGPGQSDSNVVATIARQVLAGDQVAVHCGWPRRDFVYVDDVARAFVAALKGRPSGASSVNIGSGRATSIGELARLLLQLAQRPGGTVVERSAAGPSPVNPACIVADVARARRLLGWEPTTSLEEGLVRTLAVLRTSEGASRG